MTLTNQAGYADRHGVSRKTVTTWKSRGWLVFEGDQVDVEASDANLKKYRTAGASSGVTSVTPQVTPAGNTSQARPMALPPPRAGEESAEGAAERILSANGALWDMDEAKRVKENYLALLNQLKYEMESGELVPLVQAETVLFEESRKWRDALLSFVVTYAPLIAADLGLEVDRVTEVLTPHVHKQIAALGEPEGNFQG